MTAYPDATHAVPSMRYLLNRILSQSGPFNLILTHESPSEPHKVAKPLVDCLRVCDDGFGPPDVWDFEAQEFTTISMRRTDGMRSHRCADRSNAPLRAYHLKPRRPPWGIQTLGSDQ